MKKIILFACLILAGCIKPYIPPTDNNIAKMTFKNRGIGQGHAFIFEQAEECRGMRNTDSIAPGSNYTTAIRAGNPLAFGMYYDVSRTATYYSWCEMTGTFLPEIGKKYESVITGTFSGCLLTTFDISDGERTPVKMIYRETRRKEILTPNDRFCNPMLFTATTFDESGNSSFPDGVVVTGESSADTSAPEADEATTAETTGSNVMDRLSGSYRSEITKGSHWTFRAGYENITIVFEADDNNGLRVRSSPDLKMTAVREGNVIRYSTGNTQGCYCSYIDGEWHINEDGSRLTGTWRIGGGAVNTWDLVRQ